ncbi:MAG TPA: hypothetical protein VGC53_01875 [Vicinamibacteria bacterium]|jgi:hypothetical protein
MIALGLALMLAVQAPSSQGFRTRMIVEEAGESTTYDVYFGEGTIRIDPPEAELYLLVDVAAPGLTLVYPDPGCYYRLEPPEHRPLIELGVLELSWLPWVTPVSSDLLDGVSLESRGHTRLPDGRAGLRFEGTSPAYDRVVAAYTVDPSVSPDLYYQWVDVYIELWGDGEPETNEPQQKRFDLYSQLPGLPVVSEERFLFLSRARTTRLENWEPVHDDPFAIPDEYEEVDPRGLYWESIGGRLLRQLGVKESESALCTGSSH